jgi:hypothetical protein
MKTTVPLGLLSVARWDLGCIEKSSAVVYGQDVNFVPAHSVDDPTTTYQNLSNVFDIF